MADSPTPQQQESKDDGVQLPEIGRSDSRTSLKQHQETAKEDNSNKKTTKEATPRSNSPPHSDRKNESRDERRESQSEPQDQNNTTSPSTTTKGAQQQQQESTADQSKDSSSSPSTNNNTQTKTNTKSEPQSENKKKIRFEEEEDDSKKKNNQTKNQDSNSTKNNKENKNDNDNDDKNKANKKENSSRKGNETKSPRKEKEGKKSPRKEEDETKGSKKGHRKGEGEEEEEDEAQGGNKTNRSGDMSSRSSTGGTEMSEGRSKQHEFFKNELKRLESSLKRESSKIIEPQKKAHTPFIFNTLEPYYNTKMTRFLIELPDEMKHGHTSRRTAQGLTDPWLDLKMDRDILPKVNSTPVSRQVAILKKEKEIRDRKKRSAVSQSGTSRKEGSTRLPKFPMVQLETQDLAKKQLNYSHVPGLRTELKNKYSSSARTKIDEDFKRTHADFYRMELDKLDEVHPVNRGHMKSAYFAYLQNTPGSKKAINECVKGLKSGKAQ